MTAATPGQAEREPDPWRDDLRAEQAAQAAYEAMHASVAARQPSHIWLNWDAVDDYPETPGVIGVRRADWRAAAQAVLATQQPQPAPEPGPHRHAFAAADCACDPSCECWQRSLAPQPAPDLGTTRRLLDEAREQLAELRVTLSALTDRAEAAKAITGDETDEYRRHARLPS